MFRYDIIIYITWSLLLVSMNKRDYTSSDIWIYFKSVPVIGQQTLAIISENIRNNVILR